MSLVEEWLEEVETRDLRPEIEKAADSCDVTITALRFGRTRRKSTDAKCGVIAIQRDSGWSWPAIARFWGYRGHTGIFKTFKAWQARQAA